MLSARDLLNTFKAILLQQFGESLVFLQDKRLVAAPGRVLPRIFIYLFHEVSPADPFELLNFFSIYYLYFIRSEGNEDGADLVFNDAVHDGPVAVWGDLFDEINIDSEFLPDSPAGGVDVAFIGAGMAAAAVRPDKRPGFFPVAALLDEKLALFVENEDGKRPVKRRPAVVDCRFRHGPQNIVFFINKHDFFQNGACIFLNFLCFQ